MALFDKGNRVPPIVNNALSTAAPNVSLSNDIDYPAAQTASESANVARLAAQAAKGYEEQSKANAQAAAKSASDAATSAQKAIDQADGWQEAYDEAQDAVDEAKSAVRAADFVYFGFTNLTASAESVAADQPADAAYDYVKNDMHFKIPRGLDGTVEGLAEAPVITDPSKQDYIMIVDNDDGTVKKEVINDFLNMTTKSVNGITPDANGNINIASEGDLPVFYLGETVIGSFETNPAGAVLADGSSYQTDTYPDVWEKIVSGELASVDDQTWLAGTNNVFSKGSNGTLESGNWFRVPNLTDTGVVVMTKGDFTLEGNITLNGTVRAPMINGDTVHNGDFRMQDTTRNVSTDIAMMNRSASVDGASQDVAGIVFIDRRDNDKFIGGIYTTEADNVVGLQANEADATITSVTGDVNLNGANINLNGNVEFSAPLGDVEAGTLTVEAIDASGNIRADGNIYAGVQGASGNIELTGATIITNREANTGTDDMNFAQYHNLYIPGGKNNAATYENWLSIIKEDGTVGQRNNIMSWSLSNASLLPMDGSQLNGIGLLTLNGQVNVNGPLTLQAENSINYGDGSGVARAGIVHNHLNSVEKRVGAQVAAPATAGWIKWATAKIPQGGQLVSIDIIGGYGYNGNAYQNDTQRVTFKTGNDGEQTRPINTGNRISCSIQTWDIVPPTDATHDGKAYIYDCQAVETSRDVYDIYLAVQLYGNSAHCKVTTSSGVSDFNVLNQLGVAPSSTTHETVMAIYKPTVYNKIRDMAS